VLKQPLAKVLHVVFCTVHIILRHNSTKAQHC
jgi:hypothetical protein